MAGWNYRWFRVKHPDGSMSIVCHEVYYDNNARPTSMTVDPIVGPFEDANDAKRALGLMAQALAKPLLDESTHKERGYYAEIPLTDNTNKGK